jgi:hypothetical protein
MSCEIVCNFNVVVTLYFGSFTFLNVNITAELQWQLRSNENGPRKIRPLLFFLYLFLSLCLPLCLPLCLSLYFFISFFLSLFLFLCNHHGLTFWDRGSFDQNSLDRNCVFSVDQKFNNQLTEFFETFQLIECTVC